MQFPPLFPLPLQLYSIVISVDTQKNLTVVLSICGMCWIVILGMLGGERGGEM